MLALSLFMQHRFHVVVIHFTSALAVGQIRHNFDKNMRENARTAYLVYFPIFVTLCLLQTFVKFRRIFVAFCSNFAVSKSALARRNVS